jgi:DNA processing protein
VTPAPREIARHAAGWPVRLEHLAQPPQSLWLAGPAELTAPVVAVVGARRATLAGLDIARALAADLARAGITVISGMALGIDGAAHHGALAAGGITVAVLGCGVDVCYPPRHRPLRDAIAATGLLVSEEPLGTEPASWRFPKRNRLIAALAVAVVVVEAGERSGALSTARHAADLGREVLAVPGSIRNPVATGCNQLIRDGATPLLRLDDLIDAVPALRTAPAAPAAGRSRRAAEAPDRAEGRLLGMLGTDPVHPDRLAAELGCPAAALAVRLTSLEIAGRIAAVPGGFVLSPGEAP